MGGKKEKRREERGVKNQFIGEMLTQHVTADKSNSVSKYCPYSFIAHAFIYYCLPLPLQFCRGASEFTSHSRGQAPELRGHVT